MVVPVDSAKHKPVKLRYLSRHSRAKQGNGKIFDMPILYQPGSDISRARREITFCFMGGAQSYTFPMREHRRLHSAFATPSRGAGDFPVDQEAAALRGRLLASRLHVRSCRNKVDLLPFSAFCLLASRFSGAGVGAGMLVHAALASRHRR